jgi:hypothetical protein
LFQNRFAVDINEVPAQMQMEATELQSNDSLKDAFSKGNLQQFYAGLPILNLLTIKTFAKKKIIEFGSIYICEQAFLVMDYKKNKYCSRLTNEHLQYYVTNFIFQFQSRYPQLVGDIQPQKYH